MAGVPIRVEGSASRPSAETGPMGAAPVTFFTIANAPYFPGLVGLVNSLRLVGHGDAIVVADCGLDAAQRALLAPHCTLFPMPRGAVANPTQYKPFPHLLAPKGIVVIIDSDMIVTRSLAEPIAAAARGKIAVFPDPDFDRWFGEWRDVFALAAPPRHQVYACAGFIAFSTRHWPRLLPRWWEACARTSRHATLQEGAADGPTAQGDQDALNAVLMSEFPADAIAYQPAEQQAFKWQFRRVRLTDSATLRCRFRGEEPLILHAAFPPKPWQRRGVRWTVYLHLLRRLLTSPDVALRLPPRMLERWLRPDRRGELLCRVLSLMNATHPKRAVSLGRRVAKKFA